MARTQAVETTLSGHHVEFTPACPLPDGPGLAAPPAWSALWNDVALALTPSICPQ